MTLEEIRKNWEGILETVNKVEGFERGFDEERQKHYVIMKNSDGTSTKRYLISVVL